MSFFLLQNKKEMNTYNDIKLDHIRLTKRLSLQDIVIEHLIIKEHCKC